MAPRQPAEADAETGVAIFDPTATGTDSATISACGRGRDYVGRVRSRVPSFKQWVCAPNFECQKGYGGIPRGGVALYHSKGAMSVDFMDGQTDFSGTSVYAVHGGMDDYTPDMMDSCCLGGSVTDHIEHYDTQYAGSSTVGPRLECMDTSSGETLQDAVSMEWKGILDNPDSFVGLYSMAIRPQLSPAEETYVVVVGNVGAGQATEDMYTMAEAYAEGGRSFEDFVYSPEYKYTERLAQRNRNRVAALFANVCGVHIPTTPDLFSSEKREVDKVRTQRCTKTVVRDVDKYKRGCLSHSDYVSIACQIVEGGQDDMVRAIDEMREWGTETSTDMLHYMTVDPDGVLPTNPYIDTEKPENEDEGEKIPEIPSQGDPFSETLNNQIIVNGSSVLVYRDVVPQHMIGDGNGVAMVLSPCEGLMIIHGNDRKESARSPFGNGDPMSGCFNMSPASSGRVRGPSDINWADCAQLASTEAPGFLLWQCERQECARGCHPERVTTGTVPHVKALTGVDRSVYRAVNAEFMANCDRLATGALKLQGSTRLDPLMVILAPQSLREFPDRKIPQ